MKPCKCCHGNSIRLRCSMESPSGGPIEEKGMLAQHELSRGGPAGDLGRHAEVQAAHRKPTLDFQGEKECRPMLMPTEIPCWASLGFVWGRKWKFERIVGEIYTNLKSLRRLWCRLRRKTDSFIGQSRKDQQEGH